MARFVARAVVERRVAGRGPARLQPPPRAVEGGGEDDGAQPTERAADAASLRHQVGRAVRVGFGAGTEGYWGKDGPELREQRTRVFADPDQTLVFGANTYRLMHRFAPAEMDPGHVPLNAADKLVVSRSLPSPLEWANCTLVAEDALDAIPRLKDESPVPLRSHGSIAMNRALLAAGLVDRLELTIFPIVNGGTGSNPILADLPDIDLELVASELLDGRVQRLVYLPTLR